MDHIAATLGLGIVVFASTNIDDIFLLAAFFADPHLRARTVIVGQFAGIGALVLFSAAAALAALAIPHGWVALLGLVPLALGVSRLRGLKQGDGDGAAVSDGAQVRAREAQDRWQSAALAVAVVTIANGGDNLGAYIPMFAFAPERIPAYAAIFAAMTAVWCAAGWLVANNPLLGGVIRRYGHAIVPVVLIGLGLYILSGARALLE